MVVHAWPAQPVSLSTILQCSAQFGPYIMSDIQNRLMQQLNGSGNGLPRTGSTSMFRKRAGNAAPFFIGVAGGTASGKTTVCDRIMQRLHDQCIVLIHQDSFYRALTPEEIDNVKCRLLYRGCMCDSPCVASMWCAPCHMSTHGGYMV